MVMFSNISGGIISGDFLKLAPKFLNLSETHMGDKLYFDLLHDRHFWLPETFCRNQIFRHISRNTTF